MSDVPPITIVQNEALRTRVDELERLLGDALEDASRFKKDAHAARAQADRGLAQEAELQMANGRAQIQAEIIEQRDRRIADLETEVSDLETIAEAVETYCRPRDGEEAYGWLMAQAVKALHEERNRLLKMVVQAGIVERYAQCPCCFAERTNGERHEDDCAALAAIVGDPEDDHSNGQAPER